MLTEEGCMKKASLCIVALLLVCSCAFAGPFGIEMGWTVLDLEKANIPYEMAKTQNNITIYYVEPTNPHPSFTEYMVRMDTTDGIYDIRAISDDIEDSDFGTKTKAEYLQVKEQVSSTYGTPEEFDFLKSGSIWDAPEDWMFGLYKGDRYLVSFWDPNTDAIESISLEAKGLSSTSSYVVLGYQSPKTAAIIERLKAAQASVF